MKARPVLAVTCVLATVASTFVLPWWVTGVLAGVAALASRPSGWSRQTGLPVRRSLHSTLSVAGAVLLSAAAPGAAGSLGLRADLTANQRLTLSEQTKQVLRTLRSDVEITGFFARGSGEALGFRDLLDQYQRESGHIDVRLFDPDAEPGIAQRFGLREYGTVFVDHRGRRTETHVVAEIELTSAILRVTRGAPKRICALEGHGEHAFDDATPVGYSRLAETLLANNTELVPLDLARRVGDLATCRVVAVGGPSVDLLPDEVAQLGRWLDRGGKLLAMVDPSSATDLAPLLADRGIRPQPGLVLDPGASLPGDPATLLVRRFPSLNPVGRGLAQLVLPEAGVASVHDDAAAGLTTSAVATTGSDAERVVAAVPAEPRRQRLDEPGAVVTAADLSRVVGQGRSARIHRTRIVWIGDSDFASNAFLDLVSNRQLVLNAVNWLLLDEDLISIGAPPVDFRELLLTRGQRNRLLAVTSVAMPLAVLVAGGVVRFILRRRERGRRHDRQTELG